MCNHFPHTCISQQTVHFPHNGISQQTVHFPHTCISQQTVHFLTPVHRNKLFISSHLYITINCSFPHTCILQRTVHFLTPVKYIYITRYYSLYITYHSILFISSHIRIYIYLYNITMIFSMEKINGPVQNKKHNNKSECIIQHAHVL